MKKENIFWGIILILAAAGIIIGKLDLAPDMGIFPILATVFLLWVFIEGILNIDFSEILFSLAFLYIIYDKPLGIEALSPWTVLVAALFGSMGLNLLFGRWRKERKKKRWHEKKAGWKLNENSEQCSDADVYCKNDFGAGIRYINSDNLCHAYLENNFGSLTVYFDNAIIQEKTACVEINNNFGETTIYVPRGWDIQDELESVFGNIRRHGAPSGNGSTTLYLRGKTSFGQINVHCV